MSELSKTLEQEFKDKEYAHAYMDEFLNASIATQIKVLREQRKLTQEELGKLADMHQVRISTLENVNYGSWSIKTLKKLAYAFDLTLKVTFVGFLERIKDVEELSRETLEKATREKELRPTENIVIYIEPGGPNISPQPFSGQIVHSQKVVDEISEIQQISW